MNQEQIYGCLIMIGSLLGFYTFLKIVYFHAITLNEWQTVQGVILETSPYYYEREESEDDGWKLRVLYSYWVDGIEFRSDKYSRNLTFFWSNRKSVPIYDSLRIDERITVYYNPVKPQDSVINNRFNYANLLILLAALISFIFGFTMYSSLSYLQN